MPTWNELKDYARSHYKLSFDDEDALGLVFGFNDGRSQLIVVRRFNAFDKDWIEFRSRIAKGDKVPHKVALLKNNGFACGHIALADNGDSYFLYNAPLPSMDPEEFELPLHVIAHTADDLEKDYSGDDAE
jgi:hypothetical protein